MAMTITRRVALGIGGAAASTVFAGAEPKPVSAPPPTPAPRLFELGTVTYNMAADWTLDDILAQCPGLGLKAVELRSTHKHGVEPSLGDAERQLIRRRFQESESRLFGLGSACEFHSPKAEVVRANVKQTADFVRLAHDVGAMGVKVRPNGLAVKQGVPAATTLKQIGHALRECGEDAAALGVEIWVEVHGAETCLPENMAAILEHCGHPNVGITWNSNPTDVVDGSIDAAFALLGPHIRCVHIHDLFDPYPYRRLFELLRGIGYDRYTMIEMAGSPDAARVFKYYRKLWELLADPA